MCMSDVTLLFEFQLWLFQNDRKFHKHVQAMLENLVLVSCAQIALAFFCACIARCERTGLYTAVKDLSMSHSRIHIS